MKKWINILLFGLITVYCHAQTGGYKFYATLDTVHASRFYNIALTPEITAHLKINCSDLRIVNEAGKWIPHILRVPAYNTANHEIMWDMNFSVSENSVTRTTLLIENSQTTISNIGLLITNTVAERYGTLSGSNNKTDWFVINDSIFLNPTASGNTTENIFPVSFPQNNYRYFKLVIHNKNKDPFNIKDVVTYAGTTEMKDPLNTLVENPSLTIQQKDSGKISYIRIKQQLPFHFDHISLQLTGVKYFNRKVELYVPYANSSSFSNPGNLVQSFTISNNSPPDFKLPIIKADEFYILIGNEDNLPLTGTAVTTALSNHYITAYLDSGLQYRLLLDNEHALIPGYDLDILNSRIPDSISFLKTGKIMAAEENEMPVIKPNNNKQVIWIAIAAALLILLLFTYRMFKEVDKRKNP